MFFQIYFANYSASYFFILCALMTALLVFSSKTRRQSLKRFAHADSLSTLLFLEKRTLLRWILLVGVCFFATLALMQPERQINRLLTVEKQLDQNIDDFVKTKEPEIAKVKRRSCDLIFMLDTSASMSVKDTRQKNTRLEVAKEIIDEMIQKLDGQNVALYSFTSALTPIVPLTLDYLFTRLMLQDVHLNYGEVAGTDLFESLESVINKHLVHSPKKQKVVVLLTDGGDTYLSSLQEPMRSQQLEVLLEKLQSFEEQNVRLFSIGLGQEEGQVIPGVEFEGKSVISSLDSKLLSELSQRGRGQYFFANDYSAVSIADHIFKVVQAENSYIEQDESISMQLKRAQPQSGDKNIQRYYQWPLAIALILLALEMVFPYLPVKKEVSL